MPRGPRVVVVGASLAGCRAAMALRAGGYEGALTMIDGQATSSYDRPPLTKQVLLARDLPAPALLLTASEQAALGAEWIRGVRASALDLGAVTLADGRRIGYDAAVIATGSTPRELASLAGISGTHVVRTYEQARSLRAALDDRPRHVVVVGAGFVGLEVAAACRSRDLPVTVCDPLPGVLGRVLPASLAARIVAEQELAGVRFRLGAGVLGAQTRGQGRAARVAGLELSDGSTLSADLVVVSIGARPATDWLAGSGVLIEDGVVCDSGLVVAPGVLAAGDVARWWSPRYRQRVRIEHWDNAAEQGGYVAGRVRHWLNGAASAEPAPFDPVPWFWSDQLGLKIQCAGLPRPDDDVRILEDDPERRRFLALTGSPHRGVSAAFGLNRPAALIGWRSRMALSHRLEWESTEALTLR